MDKLSKEVLDLIEKYSKEIGKYEDDNHNQNMWNECQEMGMESPIEQILYCALYTIRHLNMFAKDEPIERNNKNYLFGLGIRPQYKISNYRVDFLVCFGEYPRKDGSQVYKEVIVECDSQKFHDRTEPERRHEKQRDRFLQSKGYTIFHYTGSEIVKNPLKIAKEIISYVTDSDSETLQEDSNIKD